MGQQPLGVLWLEKGECQSRVDKELRGVNSMNFESAGCSSSYTFAARGGAQNYQKKPDPGFIICRGD